MFDDAPSARRDDSAYMRRALELARLGWGQTAPNPMVGAVVVAGDVVVGEGHHARYGEAHAEVAALRAAGPAARGATVYVTLEPCAHHGNTPPCVDALIASGVARVVIACLDPNPDARGGGEKLRSARISVTEELEAAAARELNAPFFHRFASTRPWITLKLGMSLDAAIADARRSPEWITGPESRREVHHLRAGADGIAVGIGTVLHDDPLLTVRDVPPPRIPPRRVVFDSRARIPLESALVRTASTIPTIVIARDPDAARANALRACGVEVVTAASLRSALDGLADRGIRSLLIEGGTGLVGSLIREAVVDRLIIFQAPRILGAGALNAFTGVPVEAASEAGRLRVVERKTFGDDVMTTYAFGASRL